jgi:(p)ppGpp synthase/HD superfamily hydrolase
MDNQRSHPDSVARARAFALTAHGDQRYGNHPYAFHLDAVAHLLEPYGPDAQVVGYLHDVAEDTKVSLEQIRVEFGEVAADCVALVTDGPGANREQRKAATNAKLSQVDASGPKRLALIVKAADRLANITESVRATGGSKLEMYRLEHPAFRSAAFRAGLCDALWERMEALLGSGRG